MKYWKSSYAYIYFIIFLNVVFLAFLYSSSCPQNCSKRYTPFFFIHYLYLNLIFAISNDNLNNLVILIYKRSKRMDQKIYEYTNVGTLGFMLAFTIVKIDILNEHLAIIILPYGFLSFFYSRRLLHICFIITASEPMFPLQLTYMSQSIMPNLGIYIIINDDVK